MLAVTWLAYLLLCLFASYYNSGVSFDVGFSSCFVIVHSVCWTCGFKECPALAVPCGFSL